MINVGFIVEDKPYQKFIESENFKLILKRFKIKAMGVYIAPDGRDNFRSLNENILGFFNVLIDKGAEYIYFLMDKEDDPCITFSKQEIYNYDNEKQINIIAAKAIESWFLADSTTLAKIFNLDNYQFDFPENIKEKPFEKFKLEFVKYSGGRGISKKRNRHANIMIRNGFSIQNAANHPNCPSAKYFLQKLSQLNINS